MKLTITRKVALLLLLPTCGAFVALGSFYLFLTLTEHDGLLLATAGRQRMLSEQLHAYVHMVHSGQEEDRDPFRGVVADFDQSLQVLERGGQVMSRLLPPAIPEVSNEIGRVKQLWAELKPRLLVIADAPSEAPEAQEAFTYIEFHQRDLTAASDQVVAAYVARGRSLRGQLLYVLEGIMGLDLALLFAGAWLAKHHIARPILLIAEAARHIGAGDLGHRVPILAGDELSILAHVFNTMIEGLARIMGMLETERSYNEKIVASVPVGLLVLNADLHVVSANHSFHETFAASEADVQGRPLGEVLPVRELPELALEVLAVGQPAQNVFFELQGSDTQRSQMIRVAITELQQAEQGEKAEARLLLLVEDVTEVEQLRADVVTAEHRIHHQAYHDALTGLPNRLLFHHRLTRALTRARRNHQILGLLLLDLDRFKFVNDTLGHATGDLLVQAVAGRLRESLRKGDIIARLGGDEFVVLLEGIDQAQDAALAAQRVRASLADPVTLEGRDLYVTASIGISLFLRDGDDAETLIRNADTAMYHAKAQGRDTYQFYARFMSTRAHENLTLGNDLHRALERNELRVYYQPQIAVGTGRITSVEALVRWQHPELGLLPPAEFIPVAEETGLIVPLGEWVLRAACIQTKSWQDAGYSSLCVSVNLSARQFLQRDLVDHVSRLLTETHLDPHYLALEITESTSMRDLGHSVETLRALKALGIQIWIDDFGTGYSTLSYLKRFPVDMLKIDRSLIRDITTSRDSAAIALAVIAVAHSLKLKVVAEGVETPEQLAFLREHQCDELQGYLCSPPAPPEGFEKLLTEGYDRCIPSLWPSLASTSTGADHEALPMGGPGNSRRSTSSKVPDERPPRLERKGATRGIKTAKQQVELHSDGAHPQPA